MGNKDVRRPKVDPADGRSTQETYLPGQIPVKEAESEEADEARRTEQQPNPADADKAVNPEDLSGVERGAPGEGNPDVTPVEDRQTGER
jgi:hypothetical protein